jgi:hypothetical protein
MTSRRRLAACIVLSAVAALGAAGGGVAAERAHAQKPSPHELWELYPLDPTRAAETQRPPARERPPAQPEPRRRRPPRGTVASPATRVSPRPHSADAAVAPKKSNDRTPLSFGLVLGGVLASILMLVVAALPERIPRLGATLADHRVEVALAGTLALLAVTIVYFAILG